MKACIVPAKGIGDALILMVGAYYLKKTGFDVTIFHDQIHGLKQWFEPSFSFLPLDSFEKKKDEFSKIVIQNDNSSIISRLKHYRENGHLSSLSILYPSYKQEKHGFLAKQDLVCDPDLPLAQNVAIQMASLVHESSPTFSLPIFPPKILQHRKYPKRIVLHPTSGDRNKNWKRTSFIRLYHRLITTGFEPIICISTKEKEQWNHLKEISIRSFETLNDFASFLYESQFFVGNDSFAGHLASLLHIPSMIIASDRKLMRLWQPGWKKARLLFPPRWMPNIKGFRLKNHHWQHFITVKRAYLAIREEWN